MAARLRDSVVVVAVVRTRSRAIPLAMTTMRKLTNGFPFVFHMSMGLRLASFPAAGAPLSKHAIALINLQTVIAAIEDHVT